MLRPLLRLLLAASVLLLARGRDVYLEHTKHDTTNENNNKNEAESANKLVLLSELHLLNQHQLQKSRLVYDWRCTRATVSGITCFAPSMRSQPSLFQSSSSRCNYDASTDIRLHQAKAESSKMRCLPLRINVLRHDNHFFYAIKLRCIQSS